MDSAASEGDCYIDDLPDEIFAWILYLVPIKQVIRCSIVSKRWDAACRFIIRTRESLSIQNDDFPRQPAMFKSLISYRPYGDTMREWGWFRERPSLLMDGITLADASLVPVMLKSLNGMEVIRRLWVETCDTGPMDIMISPFIREFADQLTMLEINFAISVIGDDAFPHLTRLRCCHFDAKPSAAFPKLAELIIHELKSDEKLPNMRLPSLKKLMIIKSYREDDAELVREFILANAENLVVLGMSEVTLRLHHAVVFPNLMEVDCRDVDDAERSAFPALTHLTLRRPVTAAFLNRLPAEQMLSLDVQLRWIMKHLVSAVSKMKNLKSLTLIDGGGELNDTLSIFDNMHHLERVKLVSYSRRNKQDDRMITTLVNQNPKLSHVYFCQIHLTDSDFTSLAELQHLNNIRIHNSEEVMTAGVLKLLRGSSRKVIRNFTVSGGNVDADRVTSEITLMCEERGTTVDKWLDVYRFEYEIRT